MVWKKVVQPFEVYYRPVISIFLAHQKEIAYNFPFWGEVHWTAPFFSPKVLSTWFIFAWRGSEFWLGNFENSSSRLEINCRIFGFLVTICRFFYEILQRVFLNVGIFYPLYPIVHRDLCQENPSELLSKRFCWSKKLSLQDLLPVKPQKLPPFSLKSTSYLFWRWLFAWLFSLNTGPSPFFPADSSNMLLLLPMSAIALIVFP